MPAWLAILLALLAGAVAGSAVRSRRVAEAALPSLGRRGLRDGGADRVRVSTRASHPWIGPLLLLVTLLNYLATSAWILRDHPTHA